MGQRIYCCCKKDNNEIEFDKSKINSENFESIQSTINNNRSLKSYVNSKSFFLKDDTIFSSKIEEENISKYGRIKNYCKKNILSLLKENKIFNSSLNIPFKIKLNIYKISLVIIVQKRFRGFYYRKNIFPKIKKILEKETLNTINLLYNKYLTENLIKQENNLGIKHDENSYKILLLIEKEILKNSKNRFTKLHILKYNNKEGFYIGELNEDNKLNGRGILILKDGTKYNGYFINNNFTGKGIIINNEGTLLKGNFINGNLEGFGIEKHLNGNFYEGNFLNGKKNGFGKEETKINKYEGEFSNNLKNGNGKLYYKLLNEVYEGQFENNNITGEGIYKFNNNEIYKGSFLKGKMNGYGEYFWPDGSYYKGYYINNIKEGKGIFKFKENKIFEGQFKNGFPFGKGVLIEQNKYFIANFSNGIIDENLIEINEKEYNNKWKINLNDDNVENNNDIDFSCNSDFHSSDCSNLNSVSIKESLISNTNKRKI